MTSIITVRETAWNSILSQLCRLALLVEGWAVRLDLAHRFAIVHFFATKGALKKDEVGNGIDLTFILVLPSPPAYLPDLGTTTSRTSYNVKLSHSRVSQKRENSRTDCLECLRIFLLNRSEVLADSCSELHISIRDALSERDFSSGYVCRSQPHLVSTPLRRLQ